MFYFIYLKFRPNLVLKLLEAGNFRGCTKKKFQAPAPESAHGNCSSKTRMERRLQAHLTSPPPDYVIGARIMDGQWPGLERKPVTLLSGQDIGMGVFATRRITQGQPVAHYPDHGYLPLETYLNRKYGKNSSIPKYAQEVGTSGLSGWTAGPIVLLAHNIPPNQHFGHLINHSPCQSCRNVGHIVKLIAGRPQYIFRAKRTIEAGEELLRDYGDKYEWPMGVVECPACGIQKETVSKQ